MKKMYAGYHNRDRLTFELIELPVWEIDSLGYDTRSAYFVSKDVSVQYLRVRHLDKELELNHGVAMYSLDKEKVLLWLKTLYTKELNEITDKYNLITNTGIDDMSSDLELTEKKCPKCCRPLHKSDVEGYDYVCLNCDENFYEVEVK